MSTDHRGLVALTPQDEQPEERVVSVLTRALDEAKAGRLRAVALTGLVRLGPGDLRNHYAWAGAHDNQQALLIAGMQVLQAELVEDIRSELIHVEDE